ncbi:MAG TPA: quinone oxidoreductase [Polyangiaceae bacterium]|jgi:NADPH2:quinone reductase
MTHAIRFSEFGGPDVLTLSDVTLPTPQAQEVLVRHTAIGVNYVDTYHRTGLYKVPLPSGIGVEAAGVVERVGSEVHAFKPGDRVAYATGAPGSYAEARLIGAEHLLRLPAEISDETAAAALLKGMTAEYLIRRTFRVEAGQTVLFHAAAGGVGLIACQWLAQLGVRVIGTVGSEQKAELARRHGCAETIVYTRENFAERVRALTEGRGVPVVYDSVGKSTFTGSLDCLAPRGLLVSFGNASGKPDPVDLALLGQKGSLYVTRPSLAAYAGTPEERAQSSSALFEAIGKGWIKVEIAQRFPLADAASAHRAVESRGTVGSTLLVP